MLLVDSNVCTCKLIAATRVACVAPVLDMLQMLALTPGSQAAWAPDQQAGSRAAGPHGCCQGCCCGGLG